MAAELTEILGYTLWWLVLPIPAVIGYSIRINRRFDLSFFGGYKGGLGILAAAVYFGILPFLCWVYGIHMSASVQPVNVLYPLWLIYAVQAFSSLILCAAFVMGFIGYYMLGRELAWLTKELLK